MTSRTSTRCLMMIVMTMLACAHTASYLIETSLNHYDAELALYNKACLTGTGHPPAGCVAWAVTLGDLDRANLKAAQANASGGGLPDQLAVMKAAQKSEAAAKKAVIP